MAETISVQVPAEITGPDAPAPQDQPQGENLILGKFKTQDDLIKSYQELESKLGRSESPTQQEQAPTETPSDSTQPRDDKGRFAPKPADNSDNPFAAYEQEFVEKGDLSSESIDKLAEQTNLPREVIERYVAGQKAAAQLTEQQQKMLADEVYGIVGGESAYEQMIQWASKSLDQSAIDAYDKAVQSSDPALVKIAVQGLRAQYEQAVGRIPKLISGRSSAADGGGFRSRAEMTAAISDPRYKTDSAYRADVERRIATATF
jgi:hypothetical protein